MQFRLVGLIGNHALPQLAFSGTRFRGQDMAGKGMPPDNLAGPGFLEPLGRTLMCLQLRHISTLEFY